MQALVLERFGPPQQAFALKECPELTAKTGEVRLAVEVSGLNYADIQARAGMYEDCPPPPCILGYEAVGRIDQVGAGVNGLSIGDRVLAFTRFGGYAQQVVAPSIAVVKLPENMDGAVAAALATQYSTAWYCAEEATRLHPGDHVLVHAAAGGVGTALVQIARRRGCIVIGTAGSAEKIRSLQQDQGVDLAINYNDSDFVTEIQKRFGPKCIDVAFDSIGGQTFRKTFNLLRPSGRLVSYGVAERSGASRSILRDLKMILGFGLLFPVQLLSHAQGVIGVNMLRVADNRPDLLQICLKQVVDLTMKGELRPVVGGRFAIRDFAKAHDFLGSRASMGKVVLNWDGL